MHVHGEENAEERSILSYLFWGTRNVQKVKNRGIYDDSRFSVQD